MNWQANPMLADVAAREQFAVEENGGIVPGVLDWSTREAYVEKVFGKKVCSACEKRESRGAYSLVDSTWYCEACWVTYSRENEGDDDIIGALETAARVAEAEVHLAEREAREALEEEESVPESAVAAFARRAVREAEEEVALLRADVDERRQYAGLVAALESGQIEDGVPGSLDISRRETSELERCIVSSSAASPRVRELRRTAEVVLALRRAVPDWDAVAIVEVDNDEVRRANKALAVRAAARGLAEAGVAVRLDVQSPVLSCFAETLRAGSRLEAKAARAEREDEEESVEIEAKALELALEEAAVVLRPATGVSYIPSEVETALSRLRSLLRETLDADLERRETREVARALAAGACVGRVGCVRCFADVPVPESRRPRLQAAADLAFRLRGVVAARDWDSVSEVCDDDDDDVLAAKTAAEEDATSRAESRAIAGVRAEVALCRAEVADRRYCVLVHSRLLSSSEYYSRGIVDPPPEPSSKTARRLAATAATLFAARSQLAAGTLLDSTELREGVEVARKLDLEAKLEGEDDRGGAGAGIRELEELAEAAETAAVTASLREALLGQESLSAALEHHARLGSRRTATLAAAARLALRFDNDDLEDKELPAALSDERIRAALEARLAAAEVRVHGSRLRRELAVGLGEATVVEGPVLAPPTITVLERGVERAGIWAARCGAEALAATASTVLAARRLVLRRDWDALEAAVLPTTTTTTTTTTAAGRRPRRPPPPPELPPEIRARLADEWSVLDAFARDRRYVREAVAALRDRAESFPSYEPRGRVARHVAATCAAVSAGRRSGNDDDDDDSVVVRVLRKALEDYRRRAADLRADGIFLAEENLLDDELRELLAEREARVASTAIRAALQEEETSENLEVGKLRVPPTCRLEAALKLPGGGGETTRLRQIGEAMVALRSAMASGDEAVARRVLKSIAEFGPIEREVKAYELELEHRKILRNVPRCLRDVEANLDEAAAHAREWGPRCGTAEAVSLARAADTEARRRTAFRNGDWGQVLFLESQHETAEPLKIEAADRAARAACERILSGANSRDDPLFEAAKKWAAAPRALRLFETIRHIEACRAAPPKTLDEARRIRLIAERAEKDPFTYDDDCAKPFGTAELREFADSAAETEVRALLLAALRSRGVLLLKSALETYDREPRRVRDFLRPLADACRAFGALREEEEDSLLLEKKVAAARLALNACPVEEDVEQELEARAKEAAAARGRRLEDALRSGSTIRIREAIRGESPDRLATARLIMQAREARDERDWGRLKRLVDAARKAQGVAEADPPRPASSLSFLADELRDLARTADEEAVVSTVRRALQQTDQEFFDHHLLLLEKEEEKARTPRAKHYARVLELVRRRRRGERVDPSDAELELDGEPVGELVAARDEARGYRVLQKLKAAIADARLSDDALEAYEACSAPPKEVRTLAGALAHLKSAETTADLDVLADHLEAPRRCAANIPALESRLAPLERRLKSGLRRRRGLALLRGGAGSPRDLEALDDAAAAAAAAADGRLATCLRLTAKIRRRRGDDNDTLLLSLLSPDLDEAFALAAAKDPRCLDLLAHLVGVPPRDDDDDDDEEEDFVPPDAFFLELVAFRAKGLDDRAISALERALLSRDHLLDDAVVVASATCSSPRAKRLLACAEALAPVRREKKDDDDDPSVATLAEIRQTLLPKLDGSDKTTANALREFDAAFENAKTREAAADLAAAMDDMRVTGEPGCLDLEAARESLPLLDAALANRRLDGKLKAAAKIIREVRFALIVLDDLDALVRALGKAARKKDELLLVEREAQNRLVARLVQEGLKEGGVRGTVGNLKVIASPRLFAAAAHAAKWAPRVGTEEARRFAREAALFSQLRAACGAGNWSLVADILAAATTDQVAAASRFGATGKSTFDAPIEPVEDFIISGDFIGFPDTPEIRLLVDETCDRAARRKAESLLDQGWPAAPVEGLSEAADALETPLPGGNPASPRATTLALLCRRVAAVRAAVSRGLWDAVGPALERCPGTTPELERVKAALKDRNTVCAIVRALSTADVDELDAALAAYEPDDRPETAALVRLAVEARRLFWARATRRKKALEAAVPRTEAALRDFAASFYPGANLPEWLRAGAGEIAPACATPSCRETRVTSRGAVARGTKAWYCDKCWRHNNSDYDLLYETSRLLVEDACDPDTVSLALRAQIDTATASLRPGADLVSPYANHARAIVKRIEDYDYDRLPYRDPATPPRKTRALFSL